MDEISRPRFGVGNIDTRKAPVVFLPDEGSGGHKRASVAGLARRIALLRGSRFIDAASEPCLPQRIYAVPMSTLVGGEIAGRLGIESENDLFGGYVPYPVQAGKAIGHGLVDEAAAHPQGWPAAFCEAVRPVVLSGFSAFDRESAGRAGRRLLARGPIRLKPAWSDGGHDQVTVDSAAAFDAALEAIEAQELAASGLAIEENLAESVTFSIGHAKIDDLLVSYHGRQTTTSDNRGRTAYGGSALTVVPGDIERLLDLPVDRDTRQAIHCALVYDQAAMQHLPGLVASRRNYDVISGRDSEGRRRIGVLEQSWRIGGASSAEIAAFQAFSADPALKAVRAVCVESYGRHVEVPDDADIHFEADDPEVGPLVKYARIEARSRAL